MTNKELIEKAIKYQLLNELFSEVLSELHQDVITISSERELDIANLIRKLATDDLLITNSNYQKEKRDFAVLDSSGEVLLNVSADGQSINSKHFEYYLEDSDAMNMLLKLYDQFLHADTAYTVSLDG